MCIDFKGFAKMRAARFIHRVVFFLLTILAVMGCSAPEEQAKLLVGSWSGSSVGGGNWCITYHTDYRLNVVFRTPSGEHEKLEEGRFDIGRGGRLTHYLIRQREPKEITDRARFFILKLDEQEFAYRSDLTKSDYTNRRVASCDDF